MTRYTATTRRTAGVVRLEVTGERDESSSYRHKWVTRLRLGELTAEGPNTREAVDNLADELRLADAATPPHGTIAVAPVPESGIGAAINDRLRRCELFVQLVDAVVEFF